MHFCKIRPNTSHHKKHFFSGETCGANIISVVKCKGNTVKSFLMECCFGRALSH